MARRKPPRAASRSAGTTRSATRDRPSRCRSPAPSSGSTPCPTTPFPARTRRRWSCTTPTPSRCRRRWTAWRSTSTQRPIPGTAARWTRAPKRWTRRTALPDLRITSSLLWTMWCQILLTCPAPRPPTRAATWKRWARGSSPRRASPCLTARWAIPPTPTTTTTPTSRRTSPRTPRSSSAPGTRR